MLSPSFFCFFYAAFSKIIDIAYALDSIAKNTRATNIGVNVSNTNPFAPAKETYKRDIDVLKHYVNHATLYLSKMTGRTENECREFVKQGLAPGGKFEFKDPDILYLERDDTGDRHKATGKLSQYISDSIKEERLIAPTLTTYVNPKVIKSVLVDFIDDNVAKRSIAKKEMFKAKMAKNKPLETIKKTEQNNKKLANNSISGAHVSASTPLYNKTAHSTLTSNCRTTSGYGNANNEKFLCGNRHYWSAAIVRNNVISIIANTDYAAIQSVLDKYGIRHPTVQETMDTIEYSTRLYWYNVNELASIKKLIETLSPIERSAFVYTGDLYHLRKFNDAVVRQFLTTLSSRAETPHPNPKEVLSSTIEEFHQLAGQICSKEMKGRTIRDVETDPKLANEYGILAATVANIAKTIDDYSDLIKAFWVTTNLPASVAYFPESIRHAAVTSDTDSTIFTVQEWVLWHQGITHVDAASNALAATMIFLAAQTITNVLAVMSVNFGIETKRLHQVAMKNEFKFDVFVPTQVAKHYYALIGCQEGNLLSEYDKEIKGVHLKSSNAPKEIMAQAKTMMEEIMYAAAAGRKIKINELMTRVADIERGIANSIRRGESSFFKRGQIKTPESYSKERDSSPYSYYTLWQEVFAPKYGPIDEPPFNSLKISTTLTSPTMSKDWITGMADRELAKRMADWMIKYKGAVTTMTTLQLPEQVITSSGIPPELMDVISVRKIITDTTRVFYVILESLGIYMSNDKMTRLCMDTH